MNNDYEDKITELLAEAYRQECAIGYNSELIWVLGQDVISFLSKNNPSFIGSENTACASTLFGYKVAIYLENPKGIKLYRKIEPYRREEV